MSAVKVLQWQTPYEKKTYGGIFNSFSIADKDLLKNLHQQKFHQKTAKTSKATVNDARFKNKVKV